jgi:hypothetical protein
MPIYERIGVVGSDVYDAMGGIVATKCDFEIGIPNKKVSLRIMGL